MEHDFTNEALGLHIHAEAGKESEGSFKAEKPGEYEVFCSVPGHKEAGMVGKLIAE